MDYTAFAQGYIRRREQAEHALDAIRRGEWTSQEELYAGLRAFVLQKYLLPPDTREDRLDELARLSVERALAHGAVRADHPATCEGTTSAMNKKVLLLLAVQRELGVRFEPGTTAGLETVRDIARAVSALLGGGPG